MCAVCLTLSQQDPTKANILKGVEGRRFYSFYSYPSLYPSLYPTPPCIRHRTVWLLSQKAE